MTLTDAPLIRFVPVACDSTKAPRITSLPFLEQGDAGLPAAKHDLFPRLERHTLSIDLDVKRLDRRPGLRPSRLDQAHHEDWLQWIAPIEQ